MSRVKTILDALGQAICEKGRRGFTGEVPFGDVLPDVAKTMQDYLKKYLVGDDIRLGLGDIASIDPKEFSTQQAKALESLYRVQTVTFKRELSEYFALLPNTIRQAFRRPSDPSGRSAPDEIDFYKPEQMLTYLPVRRTHFRLNEKVENVDNWTLSELRGFGPFSETWIGRDPDHAETTAVTLKFATDPVIVDKVRKQTGQFERAFSLNGTKGIVPLRQVFLQTELPSLEYELITGYDLAGLISEWHWHYKEPKPQQALKLIHRLADIVGKAHHKGIIHRDLKPSNVLIHPTEKGKFTMWISDFGWSHFASSRQIERSKNGMTKGEQERLMSLGAYTPLYTSPQHMKSESVDARDDVYALAVIWYQLLKRDLHAPAPVGEDWAEEFYRHGFSTSQMKLLTSCLSPRPEKRPGSAIQLSEFLEEELKKGPVESGSRIMPMPAAEPVHSKPVITRGGKPILDDAAARAAASLLGTEGHIGSGGRVRGGMIDPTKILSGSLPTDSKHAVLRNSIGMTFVQIPAGNYQMGAPEGEPGSKPSEKPQRTIRISRSFFLSTTPVTQAQYEKVVGHNPSKFNKESSELPVESVSFTDAEFFCESLSRLREEANGRRHYRLPTEAEWEYACRAGTTTAYSNGPGMTAKDGLFKGASSSHRGRPDPVGQYPANPWGLYDMHGNVAEWVSDWFNEYAYFDSAASDPRGPEDGEERVIRGGSWADLVNDCRSAARKSHAPAKPTAMIGFRVVMFIEGK